MFRLPRVGIVNIHFVSSPSTCLDYVKCISQLRLGDLTFAHGFRPWRKNASNVKICRCSADLTPEHFLFSCPLLQQQQRQFHLEIMQEQGRQFAQMVSDGCNPENISIPGWGQVGVIQQFPDILADHLQSCPLWMWDISCPHRRT